MAPIIEPFQFCVTYPATGAASITIELPFGLPPSAIDTSDCQSTFVGVPQLMASLSFMIPVIKIAGCLTKLVDLIMTLIDVLNAVPSLDPFAIGDALAKVPAKVTALQECVDLFLSFTFIDPTPICKMIWQVLSLCVAVLLCVQTIMTLRVDNMEKIAALQSSPDPELLDLAACLIEQQGQMDKETSAKIGGVQDLINLINVFITAIPPFAAVTGGPINLDITSGDSFTPDYFEEPIQILSDVADAIKPCAFPGGGP